MLSLLLHYVLNSNRFVIIRWYMLLFSSLEWIQTFKDLNHCPANLWALSITSESLITRTPLPIPHGRKHAHTLARLTHAQCARRWPETIRFRHPLCVWPNANRETRFMTRRGERKMVSTQMDPADRNCNSRDCCALSPHPSSGYQ